MEKTTPLIIVFYLDSDLMTRQEIIKPFVESVNQMLHHKNANALAFFLPTNGEERVECINPVMLEKADMDKINTLLENYAIVVTIQMVNVNVIKYGSKTYYNLGLSRI